MAALGIFSPGWPDTNPVAAPAPQDVAPGVWLIPRGIPPNRQPDGNPVIFDAPAGLIAVDTGRHSWQRDAILALTLAQKMNIVAIVNTHWHLDHVSGNPDLRAAAWADSTRTLLADDPPGQQRVRGMAAY